jgi:hypothetical protein
MQDQFKKSIISREECPYLNLSNIKTLRSCKSQLMAYVQYESEQSAETVFLNF